MAAGFDYGQSFLAAQIITESNLISKLSSIFITITIMIYES